MAFRPLPSLFKFREMVEAKAVTSSHMLLGSLVRSLVRYLALGQQAEKVHREDNLWMLEISRLIRHLPKLNVLRKTQYNGLRPLFLQLTSCPSRPVNTIIELRMDAE